MADRRIVQIHKELTLQKVNEALRQLSELIGRANVDAGLVSADEISYDPTDSGLAATDVQEAIDEVDTNIDAALADITSLLPHEIQSSGGFHSASGLTTGHVLKATAATTFAFGALAGTSVTNTPAGNIAATNVQAAINELDNEKLSNTTTGCSIYTGANQLIANNSATAVTFASEVFDTSAFHSTVSNTSRITIPAGLGGKYLFTFRATWAASATGYRGFGWYVDGALYRWAQNIGPAQSGTGAGAAGLSAAIVLNLTAGQYVETHVIQTSGGNLNLIGGSAGFAQSLECVFLGV